MADDETTPNAPEEQPTEAAEAKTEAVESPTEAAEAETQAVEAKTEAAPAAAAAAATDEPAPEKPAKKHLKNGVPRWQRAVAVLLLVVGFILVPLSAVAIWSRNQLLNTDRYVSTVAPLADNPDIQNVVATRAVDALFSSVDVSQKISGVLPKRAKFLGDTIASQAQGYAVQITEKLLQSSQFQSLWDGMNRAAHAQLVAVLKDQNGVNAGPAKLKDGKITLDLTNVIEVAKTKLTEKGLGFLKNVSVPPVKRTVTLIDAGGIDQARTASKLLNAIAWLLPILAIACFVGSALLVRPRRRGFIRASMVLFFGAAFTLVLLKIGRYFYLDAATPPGGNGKAAAAVWDILLRNLRAAVIILGIIGLVLAFGTWLSGSSGGAMKLRAMGSRGIGSLRHAADEHGYTPGPFAKWVTENKRGVQIGLVIFAVLVYYLWENPTLGVTVFLLVLLIVALAAVSFLARGSTLPAEGTVDDSETEDTTV
ncbi:MAG: hypothetical protein U0W40_12830 [Acidimicrobiia bacterium]